MLRINQEANIKVVQGTARILVVDNSEDNCLMMAMLLGELGYTVETARTGAEAVTLAGGGRRDLYIIDSYFTDARGTELCRQIRALDPAASVLFYSTAYGYADLEAALQSGARAFVLKPDIDELLRTIAQLLD